MRSTVDVQTPRGPVEVMTRWPMFKPPTVLEKCKLSDFIEWFESFHDINTNTKIMWFSFNLSRFPSLSVPLETVPGMDFEGNRTETPQDLP